MPEPTDLVPQPDTAALALAARAAEGALALPYQHEVFLLACHVAGTGYRDLAEVEPDLAPGEALTLRREPANPHDALAIRVQRADGTLLGYLPRPRNEVLARLLDAGKLLTARLAAKEWQDSWLRLEIEVVLREV